MSSKRIVSPETSNVRGPQKNALSASKGRAHLGALYAMMRKCSVRKGERFTHTVLSTKISSFIDKKDRNEFFKLYRRAVVDSVPTVTEYPLDYGPLRIDFDFKFLPEEGLERRYTKKMLKTIIEYYQAEIKASTEYEEDDKVLWCVLLEKEAPRVDGPVVKDGFHLHFPFFVCKHWFQDEYLRPKIIKRLEQSRLLDKIYKRPLDDAKLESIVDPIAKKTWVMYGSSKGEGYEPFRVTLAFNHRCKEMTLEDMFKLEMDGREGEDVKTFLPDFLSIRHCYPEMELKEDIVSHHRDAMERKREKRVTIAKTRTDKDVAEDRVAITNGCIMDMLSEERADGYDSWMDVGWTLFNIGQGTDEFLDLWITFSRRSAKFAEGKCEELWNKMEVRNKTMASLLAMANNDSPDAYRQWKSSTTTYLIDDAVSEDPTEYGIAKVIYNLYKNTFLCASAKFNTWYEFRDHRWREMDDCCPLRKLLPEYVADLFKKQIRKLAKRRKTETDKAQKSFIDRKQENCQAIVKMLKSLMFQNRVIKMCNPMFLDPTFLKKQDENKKIVVCENGVLDLELKTFREGRADDYATLSTGLFYREFRDTDDEVIELNTFLRKVFVNNNIRNYFLDSLCSVLEGGNTNKIVVIGTGSGDNGKSLTYQFIKNTFGEYCFPLPRELVIVGNKISSSSARPELARARGRRIATINEITQEDTLNIGVIKELSGNDEFFARNLFEKGADIKPQFTMFIQCNKPPRVPSSDAATWNRLRILPYESKFVLLKDGGQVPETEKEQYEQKVFKADIGFEYKLMNLRQAFLWLLFERYKVYKLKGGLADIKEVQTATQEYRTNNDVFSQFASEKIRKASNSDCRLTVSDAYVAFKAWYKNNYESYAKQVISKVDFVKEVSKHICPVTATKNGKTQYWDGYTLAQEDDAFEELKEEIDLKASEDKHKEEGDAPPKEERKSQSKRK